MSTRQKDFLCGVVEGFYGRPWTSEQRKELFVRMKKMRMNTYLYAPKDDCKHRRFWRDLYSVEETENLQSLMESAQSSGVRFVYAISPGLDMVFSKEAHLLKRKLTQVRQLGCNSFALLFDDIDIELGHVDKEVFQSPAHAQVAVTNEVVEYLGDCDLFVFCPTEYCASRAQPDVATSAYLNTIGARLLPCIDIMWTGPKVVSKEIGLESVKELSAVLRRRPLIWDNLHANDYDPKRIFLGPYDGRSPELIPHLSGVLTNPNCEFEGNFVALYTLSEWAQSSPESVQLDAMMSSSPVRSDIDLESDGSASAYSPAASLRRALAEWLPAFFVRKRPAPAPATTRPPEQSVPASELGIPESLPQPINSLVEPMEVESAASRDQQQQQQQALAERLTLDDLQCVCELFYLPFQHGAAGVRLLEEFNWLKCNSHLTSAAAVADAEESELRDRREWLLRADAFFGDVQRLRDIRRRLEAIPNRALVVDLMPYVRDMCAILSILTGYLKWLMLGHVPYLSVCFLRRYLSWCTPGYSQMFSSGEHEPWMFRGGLAAEFQRMLPLEAAQDLLIHKLPDCTQPSRVYSIRPYRPEDRRQLYAISAVTAPLRHGQQQQQQQQQANCSEPSSSSSSASASSASSALDADDQLAALAAGDLFGDRFVGVFLDLSSEYCFVVEDDDGVCGFACAALDAAKLYGQAAADGGFFHLLRTKHLPHQPAAAAANAPAATAHAQQLRTAVQSALQHLRSPPTEASVSGQWSSRFPSLLHMDALPGRCGLEQEELQPLRRLLSCCFAALKTNGSPGVHCRLPANDCSADVYKRFGFLELSYTTDDSLPAAACGSVLLGRPL